MNYAFKDYFQFFVSEFVLKLRLFRLHWRHRPGSGRFALGLLLGDSLSYCGRLIDSCYRCCPRRRCFHRLILGNRLGSFHCNPFLHRLFRATLFRRPCGFFLAGRPFRRLLLVFRHQWASSTLHLAACPARRPPSSMNEEPLATVSNPTFLGSSHSFFRSRFDPDIDDGRQTIGSFQRIRTS